MKRVVWSRVLRCACALACISCADALDLHDLVEGQDAGDRATENASSSDGGDALAVEASAPTGVDSGAAAPEASAPSGTPSDVTVVGVDAAAAAPTPPSLTSAMPVTAPTPVDAAPPERDGGMTMPAPTGCGCGAAPCTVHSNGVGQTFDDCVPSGTHDQAQALAACSAFTGTSVSCTIQSCQSGGGGGPGKSAVGQGACSTGASVCDCWMFAGAEVGLVQSSKSKMCDPCGNGGAAWN